MNQSAQHHDETKPLIGFIPSLKDDHRLLEVFTHVAYWHGAQVCVIDPFNTDHLPDTFYGKQLYGLEWISGEFRRPDVIYDRLKGRGKPRFARLYEATNGIPTNHPHISRSMDKHAFYQFLAPSELASLIIPYTILTTPDDALRFIADHGVSILKPAVGSYGTRIVRIEGSDEDYLVSENEHTHRLSRQELIELLQSVCKTGQLFLLQKYIRSETPLQLPFHIRVHAIRDAGGDWQVSGITPYVSLSSRKKIVNHRSALRVFAAWDKFLAHLYDDAAQRQRVHEEVMQQASRLIAYLEQNWDGLPGEIGIDIGIDQEGRVWLYEVNMNKVGTMAKEKETSKRIIPVLLAMIETGLPDGSTGAAAAARSSLHSRDSAYRVGVYTVGDPLQCLAKGRVQALVDEAEKREIDLMFFDASSIDPDNRMIDATFIVKDEEVKRRVPYPDVVCNEIPTQAAARPATELALRQAVLFTTGLIAGKFDIQWQLTSAFERCLLPVVRYTDPGQVDALLQEWKAIILKPEFGRKGQHIYRLHMDESGSYCWRDQNEEVRLEPDELADLLNKRCSSEAYIAQQYWPVRTEGGEPVDYRVHVQRGRAGRWTTTRIYPRLGQPDALVANISRGGRIPDEQEHWRSMHGEAADSRKRELGELAIAIAKHLNRNVTFMIDELGIDFLMNQQGDIRFLEANTVPETRFHEHLRAGNKLDYACYLADRQQIKRDSSRLTIGMMTAGGNEQELLEACAYSACWNGADFYWFRPMDMHPHLPLIKGYTLHDGEWQDDYVPFPDVVYDRFKQQGVTKYNVYYDRLSHVPSNHTRRGGSYNKLRLYKLVAGHGVLRKHLLPYAPLQSAEQLLDFIAEHGRSVVKLRGGTLGKQMITVEQTDGRYLVAENTSRHLLSRNELIQLAQGLAAQGDYLLQRYVPTSTRDGLPYYIRLHMVRRPDRRWTTAAYVATISMSADHIIVNHPSSTEVYAGWKLFMDTQYPDPTQRRTVQQNIDQFGARMLDLLEAKIANCPGEIAIDCVLDAENRIWLCEANMNLMGASFREFEVAKVMVPSALALCTS